MWPFDRLAGLFRNSSLENPSTPLSNPDLWLTGALGGVPTYAGPRVSETSAMRSSAVFRCVALKAGVMASLPLDVFRRTTTGRELAPEHRLYRLLHAEPNDLMSAFIWKELIGANIMLSGNHYSVIEYDNAARVTGLLPVLPQQTLVERVKGRNRYTFTFQDGKEVLDQSDVIHVPGLGFDGLKGISPIAWAGRQPIGISLALEEMVGRLHSQGAHPSGWVEVAKGISPEGLARMRQQFDGLYSGVSQAGKTMFVDAGNKWNPIQISPEDAQTLENRRFQVSDIARLFGVPEHMIGASDKQSSWGTGIEQQTIGFQKFNLDPELTRVEGELNRKLFTGPYYCEFNRDALNAMDAKTQAELFASGIMNAGFTPNEVRRKRNLPDHPDGDQLYIQAGTIPLSMAGKQTPPATPPN